MILEIILAIISSITTITVITVQVRTTKSDKRTERRAIRREEESRLSMAMMGANCSLSLVTAKALTNQKLNGDVGEAMRAAETVQKDYQSFLQRVAAESVAKI